MGPPKMPISSLSLQREGPRLWLARKAAGGKVGSGGGDGRWKVFEHVILQQRQLGKIVGKDAAARRRKHTIDQGEAVKEAECTRGVELHHGDRREDARLHFKDLLVRVRVVANIL